MKRFAFVLLLTSVVGCGDDGGKTTPADAAPVVPAHIMISGTTKATSVTSTPLAGVVVSAYQNADENTVVATATSDSNGAYTLDITTNGVALDGFVKGTISGYLDTYLYPPAALSADFSGAAVNLVTESTLELLSNICGDPISSTGPNATAAVGLEVVDSTGAVVAGAALASTPAPTKYCYNKASGVPDPALVVTGADGLGYLVDISGSVEVTATKSGMTFGTHTIKARVGTLTTTLVQGQ